MTTERVQLCWPFFHYTFLHLTIETFRVGGSCFGGEGHQMVTSLQRSSGERVSHPLRQTGSSPAEGPCASLSPYGLPGAAARLWVGTLWVAWAAFTHPEALPTGMRLVVEKTRRWRCGLDNFGWSVVSLNNYSYHCLTVAVAWNSWLLCIVSDKNTVLAIWWLLEKYVWRFTIKQGIFRNH